MFRPKLTPNYHSHKILSQYPDCAPFTNSQPMNPNPHTQPITHYILSPPLLVLDPPLFHLTHGLYQVALAATWITLYLPSSLDTNSRSSTVCIFVSSRVQGLEDIFTPYRVYNDDLFNNKEYNFKIKICSRNVINLIIKIL